MDDNIDKELFQKTHNCKGFRKQIEHHGTENHAITVYQCDVCKGVTWTYSHLGKYTEEPERVKLLID